MITVMNHIKAITIKTKNKWASMSSIVFFVVVMDEFLLGVVVAEFVVGFFGFGEDGRWLKEAKVSC